MKTELLQIEIDLLLLRYGEPTVLKALSSATNSTEEELRRKIEVLKEKKLQTKKSTRAKKQPLDIAKDVIADSANGEQLLRLAHLYQNRQFLPQLKDVKRFLGRFNVNKDVKSRNDATRIVFESLRRCSIEELTELTIDSNAEEQSSFAKLAGHIMGDSENKSSNK